MADGRRGSKTAVELMAELEANPEWVRARDERQAAHRARQAENADDFARVRAALDAAGLPSRDFGYFTSGRHPNVLPNPTFDYRASVPVLLEILPKVTRPAVKEAIVRLVSTPVRSTGCGRVLLTRPRHLVSGRRHR